MQAKLKVVVSGSFSRQIYHVATAVASFKSLGHTVLSPLDPRIVDQFGNFLYVASDRTRLISAVQSRHFKAIGEADLLWVSCADGYVGPSTAAEMGYAICAGTPIFVPATPSEVQWRHHTSVVESPEQAADSLKSPIAHCQGGPNILMDPEAAGNLILTEMDHIIDSLTTTASLPDSDFLRRSLATIKGTLDI